MHIAARWYSKSNIVNHWKTTILGRKNPATPVPIGSTENQWLLPTHPKQPGLSLKCQTLPYFTMVLWKHQVFLWEIQWPVTMDSVIRDCGCDKKYTYWFLSPNFQWAQTSHARILLHLKTNRHPVGCEAQLAWKCLFISTFSPSDFDPKVGQNDMVFSVQWGLLSRSVHARL